MLLADRQTVFNGKLTELDDLFKSNDGSAETIAKIKALKAELETLNEELGTLRDATEFRAKMGKSAGMLQLASSNPDAKGAQVVGMQKSGEVQITNRRGEVVIDEESDAPPLDKKLWAHISSDEYRKAFKSYLRVGQEGLKYDALKVLQEGVDTSGGYLVSDDILNRLLTKEPAPTNLAARVTTLTTAKDRLVVPKVVWTTDNIYTSGMRVTWTGEVPASATTHRVTEPSFGQEAIPIFTAMMSLPLTNDMIEDSSFPLVNWCTSKFSETIDLLKDNMIINGGGATQPDGILINANFIANHVHSGAAAALTWDGLLNLLFALPEQYDSNSVVVMNKTDCALALAKLQDGEGRPYWGVGTQDSGLSGQRINKDLLGYPVLFNAFMPDIAASAYPIIFGDLRGYWLINRVGFSIQVLRELYAETNQVLLLGRVRFGGKLVEDERIRGQFIAA